MRGRPYGPRRVAAYLSALNYHRWHSTVARAFTVGGTYYSEADDPAIGLVAFVPVGMSDVSSCRITDGIAPGRHVAKGEGVGWFQFGGSTYCLIPDPARAGPLAPGNRICPWVRCPLAVTSRRPAGGDCLPRRGGRPARGHSGSGRATPTSVVGGVQAMKATQWTAVRLLVLLYVVSAVMCGVGALHPPDPRTPVLLLAALAVVGLVGGAALWLIGARHPGAAVHTGLAVFALLVAVLAWRSVTAVGIVGLGPVALATASHAAFFLPRRAARAHVAFLLGAASLAAWAAVPSGFLLQWINLCVAGAVLAEVLNRLALTLQREASTDALTGVVNRSAWEAEATRHLARAGRTGQPVTVALLDLDDFKQVNDRHGHGAGDALLRELTTSWSNHLRRADLLGRYGGDEFVLCLPDTDGEGAAELLQRLGSAHGFGWSTGTATARPGEPLSDALARADADLYTAKRARREGSTAAPLDS
jgi:diguanylate cyclase (GGDEF)-like protein